MGKPLASIEKYVNAELTPNAELCPICAKRYILRDTYEGRKYGVCPACYRKAMAEAKRAQLEELLADREYDAVRKTANRNGLGGKDGKPLEKTLPDFRYL